VDLLSRDQIEAALAALDAELGRCGVRAEVYLVGGAVMCLALNARPATKDVDAWFTEPQRVRAAASAVAAALGLPEDWLRPGHFGLRGLAERVAQLGGKFDIGNGPEGGVRLEAEIPWVSKS